MIPRLYRVYQPRDIRKVTIDIEARLRIAEGCEVYVTKVGGGSEWQYWQRRYRKLCDLLSHVEVEGVKYSPRVWSVALKERFLLPDEIRLPNGRIHQQLPSTRDMDREALDSYLAQCQDYAAEFGVFLTHQERETV